MRTMINFSHNGGVDPNPWVEKDAERRASHPKRYAAKIAEVLR
jgi:hypothetical protein